jgi:drug/metabolite transporter (DMT)-like permease
LEGFVVLLSWSELDFVVSWRQEAWAGVVLVLVGVAVVELDGALGEDLAKKPRMLCCFRVAVEDGFLDSVGVFAGVRVSPIVKCIRADPSAAATKQLMAYVL